MKRILRIAVLAIVLATVASGCVDNAEELQRCDEFQDAEACTMEYDPVCAQLDGEWQTFSNTCVACTSGAVGYLEGECEAIGK